MASHNQKKQQGYIVLLSVILLGAIGATIAVSLVLLGLANSQTNFTATLSLQANSAASACAEAALDSLRQDEGYSGSRTLTIGNGSCSILPIIFESSVYNIKTTGTAGPVVRKIAIQAQRSAPSGTPPSMLINSWQEVPDF